jgi:acetylornithine deacetylase/succinyl-diaminopimelate desuccinylase-like protein
VKSTATATITVRGSAGDASLPDTGPNAVMEAARLLLSLDRYRSPVRVDSAIRPLLDLLAPDGGDDEERVRQVRSMHPALDRLLGGLVGNVLQATRVSATGPANVIRSEACIHLQCVVLPGVTRDELEREIRTALGEGRYEIEVTEPKGGLMSDADTPLRDAIESFLARHDPEAQLVPTLGYGFSDCHSFREQYGCVAYGFIPFRHADPMRNLTTKHGGDERVLVDDLAFQVQAARSIAQTIGAQG